VLDVNLKGACFLRPSPSPRQWYRPGETGVDHQSDFRAQLFRSSPRGVHYVASQGRRPLDDPGDGAGAGAVPNQGQLRSPPGLTDNRAAHAMAAARAETGRYGTRNPRSAAWHGTGGNIAPRGGPFLASDSAGLCDRANLARKRRLLPGLTQIRTYPAGGLRD